MKSPFQKFLVVSAFLLSSQAYCSVSVCVYDPTQPFGEGETQIEIEPNEVLPMEPFIEDFGGAYAYKHHLSHYYGVIHWTRITLKNGSQHDVGVPIHQLKELFDFAK